jgi:hypothetical protein
MAKYTVQIPLSGVATDQDLLRLKRCLNKECSALFVDSDPKEVSTWLMGKKGKSGLVVDGPTASVFMEGSELITFSGQDSGYLEELIAMVAEVIQSKTQSVEE